MNWDQLSEIMKSLGHPVRLRIVDLLAHEANYVGALAEQVGVSQAILSQQIAILRTRGLVRRRREAGRAVYSLAEPHLRELVGCLKQCRRVEARSEESEGERWVSSGRGAG